jgi:hypothetical protein
MSRWKTLDEFKLGALSLLVFLAWLIAATGWVRRLAVIWLAYPLIVVLRSARRRREL